MRIESKTIEEAARALYIRALKILPDDVKQGFTRLAAQETVAMITKTGGVAEAQRVDIRNDAECKAMVDACIARWGKLAGATAFTLRVLRQFGEPSS